MEIKDITIYHLIEKWQDKHQLTLDVYNKSDSDNETMKIHRSQMKIILEFIHDLNLISIANKEHKDLKEYHYGEKSLWAINQHNADKKAYKLNWL